MGDDEVQTVRVAHLGRWFAAGVVVLLLVVVAVFAFQSESSDGQREGCEELARIQGEAGISVDVDGC